MLHRMDDKWTKKTIGNKERQKERCWRKMNNGETEGKGETNVERMKTRKGMNNTRKL